MFDRKIYSAVFGILFIFLSVTFSFAYAEDCHTIAAGNWNSAIWRNGDNDPCTPAVADLKQINHNVSITTPISNSGLILNTATLTVSSTITNTGFVVGMDTNGIINSGGTVNFNAGSVINNDGLYENFGGTTTVANGVTFTNGPTDPVNSHFHNESGTFNVLGTLINKGDIHQLTNGIMEVSGTLTNTGTNAVFDNRVGAELRVVLGGIVNNLSDGTIDNADDINNNLGTINNSAKINNNVATSKINNNGGIIENNSGGIIDNKHSSSQLNNDEFGTINNSGTIENSGFVENKNKIVNDGTITNKQIIKNFYDGLIENKKDFVNESGATINNFGEMNFTSIVINQMGGTISNEFVAPNEFGNIYLIKNITNNGIVNDCAIITSVHKIFPTKPVFCDKDGDSLLDSWETNGIDFNHDKTIDLTLSGANENHKDLYLEIDYMPNHKPSNTVVNRVITSFGNAPNSLVNNPDNQPGINLHVTVDEQITHQNNMNLSGDWPDFNTIKKDKFGTPTERMNSATLDAKRFVYRYALFIHGILGTPSSGQAELPGNDFVVSLGNFRTTNGAGHKVGSSEQQSATLMHEFGHTLGLRHGGDTDVNCKPNYLSIMSYAFQFPSLVPSRPLDYSRETIGPLNENVLNESNGIPAGSFPQTIIGSDGMGNNRTATGIPIDYNNDGMISGNAARNINNLKPSCIGYPAIQPTTYSGHTDWDKLVYDFRTPSDFFSDGDHPEDVNIVEMTQEDLDFMIANTFPLLCEIPISGDWIVNTSCELGVSSTAPANVVVQNNAVMTIPGWVTLDIDFDTNNLTVKSGSGVLIKSGGKIT